MEKFFFFLKLVVEKLLHKNDVKGAVDFAKGYNSSGKLMRFLRYLANIVGQVSSENEETYRYTVIGVDSLADPKKKY